MGSKKNLGWQGRVLYGRGRVEPCPYHTEPAPAIQTRALALSLHGKEEDQKFNEDHKEVDHVSKQKGYLLASVPDAACNAACNVPDWVKSEDDGCARRLCRREWVGHNPLSRLEHLEPH